MSTLDVFLFAGMSTAVTINVLIAWYYYRVNKITLIELDKARDRAKLLRTNIRYMRAYYRSRLNLPQIKSPRNWEESQDSEVLLGLPSISKTYPLSSLTEQPESD